jgi:hypothetical protein
MKVSVTPLKYGVRLKRVKRRTTVLLNNWDITTGLFQRKQNKGSMTMEVAVTPSYISKLHQLERKFLSYGRKGLADW